MSTVTVEVGAATLAAGRCLLIALEVTPAAIEARLSRVHASHVKWY